MAGEQQPRSNANLLSASSVYLSSKVISVIEKDFPVLRRMKASGKNWNVSEHVNGTQIKLPVGSYATDAAPGNSDWVVVLSTWASQIGSEQARAYFNAGFDFATHVVTQLELPIVTTAEQRALWDNAKSRQSQARFLEFTVDEAAILYKKKLMAGIAGSSAQAAATIGGLEWVCAQSSTIGGIAVSTGYKAAYNATFNLTRQNLLSKIRTMRQDRNAEPSLILLSSNASGQDLYGKMSDWFTPATFIQSTQSMPNLGFPTFRFGELDVETASELTANRMFILDESQLYAHIPGRVSETPQYTPEKTALEAKTLYAFVAFYGGDVKKHWWTAAAS